MGRRTDFDVKVDGSIVFDAIIHHARLADSHQASYRQLLLTDPWRRYPPGNLANRAEDIQVRLNPVAVTFRTRAPA